ncbi:FadR/GntR family transcriptional regulator [Microbispora sp. H10830]|uniref:FadR/GntR family transcriptional regulator n=1 Tax=Microbispora sp. H10830 TaxID=2729109 RepID=UPI0021760609|nr:GntR family transcriptional regulator [Microbispora sp. H10830]
MASGLLGTVHGWARPSGWPRVNRTAPRTERHGYCVLLGDYSTAYVSTARPWPTAGCAGPGRRRAWCTCPPRPYSTPPGISPRAGRARRLAIAREEIGEPISPDDVLGHGAIRKAVAPVGVATGEHCHNRVMFEQLLQAGAIDFCQSDFCAIDSCRLASVNEIVPVLRDGELRAGQKLPVEKDLAERLGVARNTLREAVRALAAMRVLQTRQGDGAYVTSLSPGLLLDAMSSLPVWPRQNGRRPHVRPPVRPGPHGGVHGRGRPPGIRRQRRRPLLATQGRLTVHGRARGGSGGRPGPGSSRCPPRWGGQRCQEAYAANSITATPYR